jgi:hypothetical protein
MIFMDDLRQMKDFVINGSQYPKIIRVHPRESVV